MIINHNITAMNSYRNLSQTNKTINGSLEKLSSGLRINRAGDDAAGLAISEKMRGQVKGLDMAKKNAQDSISLIQTAEGALNETHSILQRMRELAVQSANDTNTTTDRGEIQKEMDRLRQEVDRISNQTEFNTKTLMTGSFATNGLRFHVGANENQFVSLKFNSMKASALAISGASASQALSITSAASAETAITTINTAIETVSAERSKFGAMQNRLEHTINNLGTSSENLQAAESRIRDVDMSKEMVAFSKNKIIAQSGTAMLAQANTQPQGVLQLLRG
ncbi:flagellin N-terminal helical domain-containing protein [Haliovirga abyssi]|uniref:Flagellin n=1 Tax=Haliovirga abyssi TaxID=2996794 RepID=A0AAU9DXC3_9FUSO|nr:flagellin [Haliovirga abyssi]BDU51076.1 flagellin [Haliovirga abyssi]